METPNNLLDVLIEYDAFRVCPALSQQEFITFSNDRGLSLTYDRLRQLERIGVFYPILRAYKPLITDKIEVIDGKYRFLGRLHDGEQWSGETQTDIAQFNPSSSQLQDWRTHGLIWCLGDGQWEHGPTIDSNQRQHEAYYSKFQILALKSCLDSLTLSVHLDWSVLPDGSPNPNFARQLRKQAIEIGVGTVKNLKESRRQHVVGVLCQLIANRFYYHTQTDMRRITTNHFHDWDWWQYINSWKASPFIEMFKITDKEILQSFETLDVTWSHHDPLQKWWNLVRFVSVEKRKKLKGSALLAATIREMAHMLRIFYKLTFDADIQPLGETSVQILKRIPDVSAEEDPLRALELTTNQYGINPKPQLVLLVEGETEEQAVPAIFERCYGSNPARYGIEIVNMHGVNNVDGGKKERTSAIARLVDYLHHHQTLAFVLLDNEGFAATNVKLHLPAAHSVHSLYRRATRADHIKIWKRSFEFDNFSDSELARAMNELAGSVHFTRKDIAQCRAAVLSKLAKNEKLKSLANLYRERLGQPLNKPALAAGLKDIIFDPKTRRDVNLRPIVKFLKVIERKAAMNHQPSTVEIWDKNQRSGHFGTLQPLGIKIRRQDKIKRRPRPK